MAGGDKPSLKSISWKFQLPLTWGLGQVEIHLSLLISIFASSMALLAIGWIEPDLSDFKFVAITLPFVWFVSLLVRVAIQILAIGIHGNDLETVVGPTGNLSTDYERLDGPVLLTYSAAGQSASLLLALLGFTVHAAVAQPSDQYFSLPAALNFSGGLDSRAWASQILWVNAFLFALHMLPSVPFDMRALAFGWWKIANRRLSISGAYRALGVLNSHLACLLVGIGLALVSINVFAARQLLAGAAIFIPAVYLFLVSRWEHSLASDIEDLNNIERNSSGFSSDSRNRLEPSAANLRSNRAGTNTGPEDLDLFSKFNEPSPREEGLDLDNILRKLYREGEAALTISEKEALLTASRKLKAKRHSEGSKQDT